MFCPQCGNQLPDNARFCGKCGAQIVSRAPEPEQERVGAIPGEAEQQSDTQTYDFEPETSEPSVRVSTQEAKAKADATGVSQWSDEGQCWVYPGNMTAADGAKISSSPDSFTEDELRIYKIVTALIFWIDGGLYIFGGVSLMILAGGLSGLAAYGGGAALAVMWLLALLEIAMGSFLFYMRHLLVTFNKSALTWLFRLMVFSIVVSFISLVIGHFGIRDFLMLALIVGGYFFLKKYATEHPFVFVNE